jgi:NADPH:quinone reductase-like Zn-dependent oxidoreductase
MKAIVYTKYGPPDVLQLQEIEKPSPKENEILVKVHAASLNALDWRPFTMPLLFVRMMRGGLREPQDKSLGVDIAGRVEAVGATVKQFRPGDAVFGLSKGAFAEYACTTEDKLTLRPANLSFEAAAAVPIAAFTALQGLRDKGKIQPGNKVLISGAGGGVGTFAVQIAKCFGAEVTAVCSTRNLDTARSIGADHVIDYTQEDFTKSGQRYDLIIAANGYHPILHYRRALKPNGTYVVLGGRMAQMFQGMLLGPLLSRLGNKKMRVMLTRANQNDLVFLKGLLETGKIASVIDRCYPLGEVAEAVRYLVNGHARGKVVITVEHQ